MQISSNTQLSQAVLSGTDAVRSQDKDQEMLSMSAFFAALDLDDQAGNDPVQVRNALRDSVASLTPEARKEVVATLRDLARGSDGTSVGELLDSNLPDVEKEASKGMSVDRLLEMLFMLIMLLGQSNTARNNNAAKFGEISVQQAQAAGDKGISAANANLGGALTGMVLGTVTAGVGFRQFAKGTSGQIKNISTNGRELKQLRHENALAGNALNRSTSPLTGTSPQERLHTLDTQHRSLNIQNNQPHLGGDEHAVLSQPMLRTEARINAQELSLQENQQKYAQTQYAGQVVSSFAPQLSSLAQAGAGTVAAAENSAAKINDAEGAVASTVQHNEEQAAQRSVELLTKIFSLIVTSSEQNRSTLDAISQAIKV